MTSVSIRPLPLRITLLLALTAAFAALSWFVVWEALGHSFVTFAARASDLTPEARLSGADTGARLAAHDPFVHYVKGSLYLAAALDESIAPRLAAAVAALQVAARLSPEDYRIWLALGRALERGGEMAEARSAFERAALLAPHHFEPRWRLGNHLLRVGRRDEAFAEMRAALSNRPAALPLIFDYAWNSFGGDARAVTAALAPPPEARALLVALLVGRGRVAEGLSLWRGGGGSPAPADVRRVTEALTGAGRYAAAYEVWLSAPAVARPTPDPGSLLSNGSFERDIALEASDPFLTWRLARSAGVTLSLDATVRREGSRSLRLSFEVNDPSGRVIVAQTVPTPPGSYRLRYQARTENLQSLGPLALDVVDAASGRTLASAAPPGGSQPWKSFELNFRTDPKTEAVTVRFIRPGCGESPCPLRGRIWLDNFELGRR